MEPFNYAAQLQAPSFTDSLNKGFAVGAAMKDQQMQEQAFAAQQQQLAAAAAQKKQQQDMLLEFSKNPNPKAEDYARITAAIPQLSEGFKRSWDILQPAQKDAHWNETVGVYAATLNNKPEAAAKILNDKADALENGGDTAKAEEVRKMADLAQNHPEYAKKMAYLSLYSQDPEKAAKLSTSLDEQAKNAAELPGQVADAQTKQVTAKYADSKALADLEKTGWDIKGIQADIGFKKESSRIAAINAAISRETNGLKRQELQLKLNDAVTARDEKVREKTAGAESGAATIDNMLNTADRILKNPSLNKVVGSIQGRMGSFLSDEGADAIALIDTLGSQAFLSQLPAMKGLGALSEKEGDKLQASLTNLSRVQSEDQFRKNLGEAQRLMLKARKTLSEKTGVPLPSSDRPDANKDAGKPEPAGAAAGASRNITVDF